MGLKYYIEKLKETKSDKEFLDFLQVNAAHVYVHKRKDSYLTEESICFFVLDDEFLENCNRIISKVDGRTYAETLIDYLKDEDIYASDLYDILLDAGVIIKPYQTELTKEILQANNFVEKKDESTSCHMSYEIDKDNVIALKKNDGQNTWTFTNYRSTLIGITKVEELNDALHLLGYNLKLNF